MPPLVTLTIMKSYDNIVGFKALLGFLSCAIQTIGKRPVQCWRGKIHHVSDVEGREQVGYRGRSPFQQEPILAVLFLKQEAQRRLE